MYFANAFGSHLQLTIVSYQYPQMQPAEKKDWDANWLKVRLDAALEGRAWTATKPCMTTWEVEGLAVWLDQLRLGQPLTHSTFEATEPMLHFLPVEMGSPAQLLRVYIEGTLRPPWRAARYANLRDLWIDFTLAEIDLQLASQRLRAQLTQFPVRSSA